MFLLTTFISRMTLPTYYERVATDEIKQGLGAPVRPAKCQHRKKIIFHVLGAAAIIYSVAYGLQHVLFTSLTGPIFGGKDCHSSKLPTHYTLSSGAKIPSVALGESKYGRALNEC
jgi:hypothetical protein